MKRLYSVIVLSEKHPNLPGKTYNVLAETMGMAEIVSIFQFARDNNLERKRDVIRVGMMTVMHDNGRLLK